jgi:hypothetical protein
LGQTANTKVWKQFRKYSGYTYQEGVVMKLSASITRWRGEPHSPAGYNDVVKLVALARKARNRTVEFEWSFGLEALRELREAIFAWSSTVVGRYRCFDARVLAAINKALDEHDNIYVLREPKNARHMDCKVSCSRDGDGFCLSGHAPFDVVFGYAHNSLTSIAATRSTPAFCSTLVKAGHDLGWNPQRFLEPRLLGVRNTARRFFGPGIKLPARIPHDRPLRLRIASEAPVVGMPNIIEEG